MVLSTTPTRHNLIRKSTDGILAAADRAEPKIRRAMLNALETLQRSVPNIERLIASGNTGAVVAAVSELSLPAELVSALSDATLSAAVAAATPEAASFGIAMNEPNVRAIRWAQANAAKDVSLISTVQREVVQEIIQEAITRGIHPRVAARQIKNVVPLLPQHQRAVTRLFNSSLESGVTVAHAEKIAARKSKKLLRYRAEMIARTEAIKASNMGQQLVWETAGDLGLIPAGTKKIWVATGDDRTCVVCAVMDGQTVEMTGNYSVTRQATGFVRSGSTFRVSGTKPMKNPSTSKTPPAHPQCRCTMVLETIEAPAEPGVPSYMTPTVPTVVPDSPDWMNTLAASGGTSKQFRLPDGSFITQRELTGQLARELRDDVARHPRGPQLSQLLDTAVAGLDDGVSFPMMRGGLYGYYTPEGGGRISLNGRGILNEALTADEIKSTMLHELIHATDDIAMGGEKGAAALRQSGLLDEIGDVVRTGTTEDAIALVYASKNEFEALAEIATYDVLGVTPRLMTTTGLRSTAISADEFAARFPSLSGFARRWMQGEFA